MAFNSKLPVTSCLWHDSARMGGGGGRGGELHTARIIEATVFGINY